ncbi:uncharacterized protein [Elaeis guineensis]|uniref:uncharacterized protein n=1 Tax=Elaeis guineensis var. tenera TaxID=51953 RepID=UPI003C6CD790
MESNSSKMVGRLGTGTSRKKGRRSMEIWKRKDSGTRIRISSKFVGSGHCRRYPLRRRARSPRASSRSSPTEVSAPESRPKEAPRAERRRRKKTLVRKTRSSRAAVEGGDGSEEDPGENPFNNRDLIKRLIDGCILSEVVHRIVHVNPEQQVWDSLGSFLEIGHQLIINIEAMNNVKKEVAQAEEGRQAEAGRLEEKVAEVASLREALQKEGQTSTDQRAALKEERKKAEAEVSELKAQIPTLVSEARIRAVEEFKIFSEMRDLKVQFGQAAFIKGFELC